MDPRAKLVVDFLGALARHADADVRRESMFITAGAQHGALVVDRREILPESRVARLALFGAQFGGFRCRRGGCERAPGLDRLAHLARQRVIQRDIVNQQIDLAAFPDRQLRLVRALLIRVKIDFGDAVKFIDVAQPEPVVTRVATGSAGGERSRLGRGRG